MDAAAWESLFEGSLTLSAEHTDVDTLAELPARRGVLLFADALNQPIQLIQTANLRTLSRSRLADSGDDTPHRKADMASVTRQVYYVCCTNDFERQLLYQRLTHAVFGTQWKKWIALPRRVFAAIDRTRPFPYFYLTGAVESDESVDVFGPFANRRTATQFCESLNFAFELCRNPALLDSGNPESCPYRQMRTCHGLCCRENGRAAYAQHVDQAVWTADGNLTEAIDGRRRQMKQAAAVLDFETAQRRKKQTDRLNALLHPDFAWTGRLTNVRIIQIGRGEKCLPEGGKKKIQYYHCWFIDIDGVCLLGRFAENDPAEMEGILKQAELNTAGEPEYYPYALNRQEHVATIGWFLYRKNRPGLWFNASVSFPTAERILNELCLYKD